jgi:hypothetical protein
LLLLLASCAGGGLGWNHLILHFALVQDHPPMFNLKFSGDLVCSPQVIQQLLRLLWKKQAHMPPVDGNEN